MKKLHFLLQVLLLSCFSLNTIAQNTMYFMDRLPQQLNFNPALMPRVNFFLNLPGIGGNQIDIYNSGFNYRQFMDFQDNLESENYNPDEFINSIGDFNQINLETRTNLLAFGFGLKNKGYFSMSASVRSFLELKAPSNFVYLLDDYEKIADRMPLNIEGANVVFNSFSQVAITYSRVFGEKFTIGISPKLIGALGGIRSDKLSLEVSQTGQYDFETEYSGEAQIGLPVPINPRAIDGNGELDEDEDILPENWKEDIKVSSLFQNAGFAFDFGVNYEEFPKDYLKKIPVIRQKVVFKEFLDNVKIKTLHFWQGVFIDMYFYLQSQGMHYWGDINHKLDLTSYEDTAHVVATAIANPAK